MVIKKRFCRLLWQKYGMFFQVDNQRFSNFVMKLVKNMRKVKPIKPMKVIHSVKNNLKKI